MALSEKVLFIDAFAGISGDMFLSALVDLGFSGELLSALPGRLGFDHASIEIESVVRKGIAAKRVVIHTPHEHQHRHLSHIETILRGSDLPPAVVEGALGTFRKLAEAEARIHATTPERIHFHEVGAVDSILDITGVHLGLHELGVERVICSPLPLARGEGNMAHGRMPLPAPATLQLLAGVPTKPIDVDFETVTPTGAALAVSLATSFENWPTMTVAGSGWGAGTKEGGALPNLLRLVLGTRPVGTDSDRVWVLECEVDDMNPEWFESLWTQAFAAGALDLYLTPVQMKKGRPGTLITLLVDASCRDDCGRVLLESTTTLGFRRYEAERVILEREIRMVETEYGVIPVKVATRVAGKVAPESAAVNEAALRAGVPVPVVYQAALAAAVRK